MTKKKVENDENELLNSLVNEPHDEPVAEPVAEPVDEPVDEPVAEPVDEPVDEPVAEPVDEPADEPVDEPVAEPKKRERKKRVKKDEYMQDADFEALKAELNSAERKPEEKTRTKKIKTDNIITGYLLLFICDAIFPMLIWWGLEKFKGIKINANKLKLSNEQIKSITPVADAVVAQLNTKLSPIAAFSIMLGMSYLENTIKIINE